MFNVLEDRVIRFKQVDGSVSQGSLPEVYASLMRDRVLAFPALRPHQRHAWHAFLVQLGAMAMHHAGLSAPCNDASGWRRIIHALTPGFLECEPWHLVAEDITDPAFMQPPASSKDRSADYKNTVTTPDELDMLVTSKNHDLKASVASSGDVDDWIFALISLQTSAGVLGSGNYGISRMNSGFSSRPAFSITPSISPGAHVRRDIVALIEYRDDLLNEYDPFLTADGMNLLWLKPWDGTKPEALSGRLDPFYIEICRRIRLRLDHNGQMYAIRATSKAARINSKSLNGIAGDPWTPISMKDSKSLTLSGAGFNYRRTAELLSPEWKQPVLLKPTALEESEPRTMMLVARGIVRGQGKTEGYHERIVPLKEKVVHAFGRRGGIEDLGDISRERIEDVRKVQRFLRHAVSVFAAGGATNGIGDEHRERANAWANKHDEIVDRDFFDCLQDEFERDDAERRRQVRNEWRLRMIGDARELLHQSEDALPCPSIQRYHARVRAESVFEGRVRSRDGFPELYPREEETGDQPNDDV